MGVAAWGQATAQIHGTVQDASGSAVPGAEIKATQTETGLSRTASSGADGGYVLTNLPLGPYQLEVTKEGFTKYVQSGIVLQVNSDPAIDAGAEGRLGKRAGRGRSQRDPGGDAQLRDRRGGPDAAHRGPAAQRPQRDRPDHTGRRVCKFRKYSIQLSLPICPMISIAGQAASGEPFGTEYTLDGANHINYLTGTTMPIAFPDAVQEFKVESSGQTAQHGSSAAITVVTRSGSNEFHGNLFEFIRNSGFGSAREYFSTDHQSLQAQPISAERLAGRSRRTRCSFSAVSRAPVIRHNPDNTITTVPTAAMLSGDWTTFASAAVPRPALPRL